MAAGKVIGQIEVTKGSIKIVGVDGIVREPGYEGFLYENEQVISNDPTALFQIKFLALPEASAYDGVFRILADGSVIHGRDAMDSIASDEDLSNILETAAGDNFDDLETAAGEESAEGSSSFTPTNIVAESSVLGFNRGANGELGFGITDFGGENVVYDLAQEEGEAPIVTPPVITSPNVVIYDENGTEPVIQVEANGESSVSYSIAGLDSEHFTIDPQSGVVTFNDSPDFENPKDLSGDNEYNVYVTATDEAGNYTTQLLSVSINNLNDNIPLADDGSNSATEDVPVDVSGQVAGSDADGNAIEFVLVKGLNEGEGTLIFNSDGSYTYNIGDAFQSLDEGETKDITFTYKTVEIAGSEPSDQGPFESAEATVTITITGAEDGPVVSGIFTGAVAEDAVLTVSGTLAITDVDTLDNPVDFNNVAATVGDNGFGTFELTNGEWTYTLNNDAVQFLGDGESREDTHTFTATDGSTQDVVITIAGAEDGPTIIVTATPNEIVEDSATQDTIVASFAADDVDSDNSAMTYEVTVGTDLNGYYVIDGSDVKLTAAGVAHVNSGGELPDVSVTVYSSGLSAIGSDAAPEITPAADPLVVSDELGTIGEPLFDLADFTLEGDTDFINGVSTTYSSNGLVITSDTPLNFNPGHGLGVDTLSDNTQSEAMNIDGRYDEGLNIELPSSVFALNIDLKLTSGDLIEIKLYDANGNQITSGVTFAKGNETLLSVDANGYINGNDLKNGGDTIRIMSDTKFAEIFIADANADTQDGFSLINIYDPMSVAGYYTYEYNMDLVLQEIDEAVDSVTISGFDDTTTKIVFTYGDSTQVEYTSDADGMITIDDSNLLSDVVDGDVVVTIAAQNEIIEGFQPAFDAITIESESGLPVSHTILGGTADEILAGEDGNDYIDGRDGSDTIYGGAGNDDIEYDALDAEIDGGDGFDTVIGSSEIINLSNISNIEVIELNSGTSVVGSSADLGINADDVLSATDGGTLIIQSSDGSDLNQVNVDTDSLALQLDSVSIDGINYAEYTGGGATLLIELDDSIDVI
ncbi:hypothetical protein FCU45_03685 [Sulfurimonas crateris]|uniref:Cadherin domain-containing protein n=1 Tax=Sulfurimonas crateris TaxID=2574727 RepID=A0A4U2Z7L1_9BACT|nr:VCBS domain-containing protein [Sulfurimonas crateris]TKI70396.1 hypothetical protein FCU45_03685 [Sulfurimonas crateris]